MGLYTTQLEDGTWNNPKSVTEEYAEQQADKSRPKIVAGEKKPASSTPAGTTVPTPSTPLPE